MASKPGKLVQPTIGDGEITEADQGERRGGVKLQLLRSHDHPDVQAIAAVLTRHKVPLPVCEAIYDALVKLKCI